MLALRRRSFLVVFCTVWSIVCDQVRKASHHAVGVVLRGSVFMKSAGSSSTPLHHPAAADVAKFCREEIEKCGGTFVHLSTYIY